MDTIQLIKKNNLEIIKVHQTEILSIFASCIKGNALKYTKNKTPETCIAAIMTYGEALCFIKDKTKLLCTLAVLQNGISICHVPKEMRTNMLCELAVRINSLAIFGTDQTNELCSLALMDQNAYRYVKSETDKPSIYHKWKNDPYQLYYFTLNVKNYSDMRICFNKN